MTSTASDCGIDNVEALTIAPARATAAASTLKALAEPLRLRMLAVISQAPRGEACVCDLSALTDVSDPTISYHLKALRTAGLVRSERRGTWVYYSVEPSMASAVEALMHTFATTPPAEEPPRTEGVDRVQRALESVSAELHDLFPDLEQAQVERTVQESYTALSSRARVRQYLVPLTRQFARQRLADVAKHTSPERDYPPQVLFVCVQNAGRSQLAAALLHHYAGDRVVVRSAGSMPASGVHDAVQAHIEDISPDSQPYPKPLTDDAVRASDVVITMGCGDVCPIYPGKRYDDWKVGDPALASEAGVQAIRDDIDRRVRDLLAELVPDLSLD
ncbi:metalloregulator ArsR/SmtB family transcription factor [Demequina flava]|uniref:metalloregulator ArsR/SmtB family transcription factor n=1 Tax=Demequina flava TaxID=1095025 RepID=UPI0007864354|nr:metalloregulator ArsR/SmtB family transcription factor [Demequina flava]